MTYQCETCSKEFDILKGGYMGSHPDADPELCHPMISLVTLCRECYQKLYPVTADSRREAE